VFLEASAFEQAVEIARAHPGVQYGASIEIHPWSPPGPVSLPNPT
jgi:hypothetical protein